MHTRSRSGPRPQSCRWQLEPPTLAQGWASSAQIGAQSIQEQTETLELYMAARNPNPSTRPGTWCTDQCKGPEVDRDPGATQGGLGFQPHPSHKAGFSVNGTVHKATGKPGGWESPTRGPPPKEEMTRTGDRCCVISAQRSRESPRERGSHRGVRLTPLSASPAGEMPQREGLVGQGLNSWVSWADDSPLGP